MGSKGIEIGGFLFVLSNPKPRKVTCEYLRTVSNGCELAVEDRRSALWNRSPFPLIRRAKLSASGAPRAYELIGDGKLETVRVGKSIMVKVDSIRQLVGAA